MKAGSLSDHGMWGRTRRINQPFAFPSLSSHWKSFNLTFLLFQHYGKSVYQVVPGFISTFSSDVHSKKRLFITREGAKMGWKIFLTGPDETRKRKTG